MANIYDGAFRTLLNDCRKWIIPVINEIFGETYTGDEVIEFFPNEHFMNQQDAADIERITDSNFTILGKVTKKYHIECESSLPNGKIAIRLFEYDAQIALDEGEVTEETLTVTFPNTAVLYLRTRKDAPDKMKYVIITPGGTVQYDIPVMKVQTYSLDDIFHKNLLFLIPFYIFSYEERFFEYNSNEQKLKELEAEYQDILDRLNELANQGFIEEYDKQTIIDLAGDVIMEITKQYEKVQESVGGMMKGALIETNAKKILNQGIEQGRSQGIAEGRSQGIAENKKVTALNMLKKGKLTIEEIAEYSELSVEDVEKLAGIQKV